MISQPETDSTIWPPRPGEVHFEAVRSGGPGGQNVNKVATSVILRFDIRASALSPRIKDRLLTSRDRRITDAGVVVIKAGEHRSQAQNRQAALERLRAILQSAARPRRVRKKTRPTRAAREHRLEEKKQKARTKNLRGRVEE